MWTRPARSIATVTESRSPEAQAPRRRGGLSLGSWAGVPIVLDLTWLLLAAYITVSFVNSQGAQHTATERYAAGVATSVLLAASVLLHELGHAVTAQALGMRVRRITLYLLGGVSEIEGEATTPANEYLVALAGPLVSVLLAAAGGLGSALAPEGILLDVLVFVTVMNVLLAVFNLLPGLPLDGGRVLRAIVWRVRKDPFLASRAAAESGRALGGLLIAVPVIILAFGRTIGADALVSAVVGLYISLSATQALARAKLQRALPTVGAAQYARPLAFIPVSAPVSELVRRAQLSQAAGVALVDSSGRIVALVDEEQVRLMPEQRRPWVTADQVSQRLERWHLIDASLAGAELLEKLRGTGAAMYLVMESGKPRGLLDAREVVAAVQRAVR
ncbi:MAG: Zn-dependent protease-like protein [Frankiales bacterium]|nr:Zn-dependent protease-like protein [Frankiales bacterium]